jgi:hypothetical protein
VEFKPTIPVFERTKTVHALDRAAAMVGNFHNIQIKLRLRCNAAPELQDSMLHVCEYWRTEGSCSNIPNKFHSDGQNDVVRRNLNLRITLILSNYDVYRSRRMLDKIKFWLDNYDIITKWPQ